MFVLHCVKYNSLYLSILFTTIFL